jgi:hypothetical protein
MNTLSKFLNKRYSTRKLSDEEFDRLVAVLAVELSAIDFVPKYETYELLKDWENLKAWKHRSQHINSTSRIGMKLCEHFFPNFYDIEDKNGNSFRKLWKDTSLLQNVFSWNRKCHSTPYLSELKRGVYFCGGLCKSTMYRPQIAKIISNGAKVVLDPCMGWGGRLLGAVSSGSHYVGFDPNTETYSNLNKLVDFLGIRDRVTLICDDALNMDSYDFPNADVVLTSPPYFDLEIYCKESTQSVTGKNSYEKWISEFLDPLIKKCTSRLNSYGRSCWNVAKVGKNDMWESVNEIHASIGFQKTKEYGVKSSARQVNQTRSKNKKSVDFTIEYTKEM